MEFVGYAGSDNLLASIKNFDLHHGVKNGLPGGGDIRLGRAVKQVLNLMGPQAGPLAPMLVGFSNSLEQLTVSSKVIGNGLHKTITLKANRNIFGLIFFNIEKMTGY